MVNSCSSVEVIFEVENQDHIRACSGISTQLKSLSFVQLPKLKHLWSISDLEGIFNLQNLGSLIVKASPTLNYVFPVSEAKNLVKLKDLLIENSPNTVLYGRQGINSITQRTIYIFKQYFLCTSNISTDIKKL